METQSNGAEKTETTLKPRKTNGKTLITNKNIKDTDCDYPKRSGTSGLTGQLYETKLLTLILLRALNNDNIKEFILATNMDGVGAFDDIILRYKTSNSQKEKIIFIQAKHKDDPNKDKLTVKDIMKPDGDFSLQKYLESFIKIKQKFITDKTNKMFLEPNNDIEYEYIIYTSANEQLDEKKTHKCANVEEIIRTNKKGKYFQFVCDTQDIELLVTNFVKSRAIALAKALTQFIIKDNWYNIMLHDLMKTYHVFVAQNIITVECTSTETKDSKDSVLRQQLYNVGTFRQTFWTSFDDNLILIRRVLCKEIAEIKGISLHNKESDVVNFLNSLVFKLPTDFGNVSFNFHGNEKKQQKRFDHVCSIFQKLLQNTRCDLDCEYIYIKLDDDSVGLNNIIQRQDLESYRLGGLVGNLLINDDKTDMLKFNLNIDNLSKDNIKMLNYLQKDFDLSKYRFDINVLKFPKLTLTSRENDKKLIKDFLNILMFYTNQSKEDEVENVVKQEIDKLFSVRQKQQDSFFRIKCDAIFLKIHDKIQKWWKEKNYSLYLTKTCKFYEEAEQEILQSPLLSIINFNYRSIIKNNLVKFNDEVVSSLNLITFLNSNEMMLIFLTDDVTFSSIKVIQYFDTFKNENDYVFIDLEFVIVENGIDIVQMELECSAIPLLIVISRDCNDGNTLSERLNYLIKLFKGKVILITHKRLKSSLQVYSENILQNDDNNNFSSFSEEVRNLILEDKKVIFQGVEVAVVDIFDNSALNILTPNLLYMILHDYKVEIGKTLATELYYKTIGYYIQQSICRYIRLHGDVKNLAKELLFIKNTVTIDESVKKNRDIVITTSSFNTFTEVCQRNSDSNVHWFSDAEVESQMRWIMSHGSLYNIKKFTMRGFSSYYSLKLQSLKSIKEKVVIISAEPGMGKSTFLTHIAYNTKRRHPQLWIIRINLIDHVHQFSEWKKNKTNIDLKAVITFFYNVIYYESDKRIEKLRFTGNITEELDFINVEETYLPDVDLTELKLFIYFYNNHKIAILLDGFDEVCPDFSDEVIQLLRIIKSSKVSHLWVTSRLYNVLNHLELALCTFSHNLNPLSTREQKMFLEKVWAPKLSNNKRQCSKYAENFHYVVSTLLNTGNDEFLSLPLHLHMILEVFDEYIDSYVNLNGRSELNKLLNHNFVPFMSDINLNSLYENFINKKYFQIRFGEKKHSANLIDPDIRKIVEKEHGVFLENHKKVATHFLLNKYVMLSNNDMQDIREFAASIRSGGEKTGIIERIVDKEPKFVHLTFAEYFAAEFVLDKIRPANCTFSICQYFVNNLLIERKYLYIRRFINAKLKRHEDKGVTKPDISVKDMKIMFNLLMKQITNTSASALFNSFSENLENITILLLQCVMASINKKNVSKFIKLITKKSHYGFQCLFCGIIDSGERAAKFSIEMIKNTDCNRLKDLFNCTDGNPLLNTYSFYSNSDTILKSLQNNPEVIVQVLTTGQKYDYCTPSHLIASEQQRTEIYFVFLQELNNEQLFKIFTVKDSDGNLPLHYAARKNNYDYFYKIDELLGRDVFKRMCISANYNGLTPTSIFIKNRSNADEERDILEKVYEGIDIFNVEFYKLPLIYPKKDCVIT